MAMMSGRGVDTSRTIVSRKSTSVRSISRACPSGSESVPGGGGSWATGVDGGASAPFVPGGTLSARARPHAQQRAGQRPEHARHHVERRQQHVEDPLGILADDEQRHQVLAGEAGTKDREDENGKALRIDPDHSRKERRRQDGDRGEKDSGGNEQPARIFEVRPEGIAALAALGHDSQRQPHQRAERGCDGADIDRGTEQQKQEERRHRRVLESGLRRQAGSRHQTRRAGLRACAIDLLLGPSGLCPPRDRIREGVTTRAGPGRGTRLPESASRSRA